MSSELESVYDAAMRLSIEERAELTERLLDSIDGPEVPSGYASEDEFLDELDRRRAEGPEATVSWESVRDAD